jgi:Tol biopolymer transport system component
MPLAAGTILGNYEIVAPIGAGGMGEVYRARDTRLARDVAIKILPASLANDSDRMRRFEHEARAVAALNHPNVLSVFDTGAQDGVPYLVTELLEGESLRQILERGPLPVRRAVDFARQIADGLAAAHDKKIVHRDLKPDNVFIATGNRVKILDFGLAKMPVQESPVSDGDTATISAITSPGVVMGTAGYMAPEQVRGQSVDHRADIFSFGALLYEMLTGQRAFRGETAVETMNAILKEEPPELDGELRIAPALDRVVRHCLEKKPDDRFQSARDLMFALGSPAESVTSVPLPAAPRKRSMAKTAAAAVAGALLIAAITWWITQRSTSSARMQFAIAVPGEVSHLALSADGKWLAFVTPGENGVPLLYVQRIGLPDANMIAGSEGASYPFWSPDAAYVAFFANGKLQKAAIGGSVQTIAAVGGAPRGGSWSSKGVILYARDVGGPLWRVNADGNGAAPATEKILQSSESSHRWPFFLPDGDQFLMFAGNFNEKADDPLNGIYLSSLSKHEKKQLASTRSNAVYSEGRMYSVDSNGALVASPLDLAAAKINGPPTIVAPKTAISAATYYGSFSVSANSTIVFSGEGSTNSSQLTWMDRSGREAGRVGSIGVIANPAISPDGKRVSFDVSDVKARNVDVWILDFAQNNASRFTFKPAQEFSAVWSHDGSVIAYLDASLPVAVRLKKANGLEAEKPLAGLADQTAALVPTSWSPDGRQILCTAQISQGNQLLLQPVDGGAPVLFLSAAGVTNGQISPDGKWAAYASTETGESEIYVTTFPAAAGKWQVSRGGGAEPRWRGDGKAIFYIGPRQMMTESAVNTDGAFSAGSPHELFAIRGRAAISSTDLFTYDVTRDGTRFLVNQYIKPERAAPLHILLNVR